MVVDLFHRMPRIIGADEKILIDAGRLAPSTQPAVGGVVLNHLGWARMLGLETGIFGKMGDDRHGEFLRAGMDAARHPPRSDARRQRKFLRDDLRRLRTAIARSTWCAARPPSLSPRRFARAMASLSAMPTWCRPKFRSFRCATVIAILRVRPRHSIPTVLDVDVPPSDACAVLGTRASWSARSPCATFLKPAKAAARELAGSEGDRAADGRDDSRRATATSAVVITDGARGCAIAAAQTSLRVPAFKVKQIDTTGAGDAFLGAMLAGLRWKLRWPQIGRLAMRPARSA